MNQIRMNRTRIAVVVMGLLGPMFLAPSAQAALIQCGVDDAINHMLVDSSQVSACLDSGTGNLNGNAGGGNPDPFLDGVGSDFGTVAKSDDSAPAYNLQAAGTTGSDGDQSPGTWSFDANFWDHHSTGAIGFKFGTGNEPDEWFVYSLVDGITSGDWIFVNQGGTGGGLSHVNLYASPGNPTPVPAPGVLALFGLGLALLGVSRRGRTAPVSGSLTDARRTP